MAEQPTSITVVIPTCNRPDDVARCLSSLAAVRYPDWEVLVVDQSADDLTAAVVEASTALVSNLHHVRLELKGVARARNHGLAWSRKEIVLLLDDDCAAMGPDFLANVAAVHQRHPRATIAFGEVIAAPHDPTTGFIPTRGYDEECEVSEPLDFQRILGLSACLSIRRDDPHRVDFDLLLGPGAHFNFGGDDVDYAYRTLMSGGLIVVSPEVRVEHYGYRPFGPEASRVARGYMNSLGAQNMKMLRCRDRDAALLIARETWGLLTSISLRNLVRGRRPNNALRPVLYVRGLVASFGFRVDRSRGVYVVPGAPS